MLQSTGVAKSLTQLNNKPHLAMSGNVSVVINMGMEVRWCYQAFSGQRPGTLQTSYKAQDSPLPPNLSLLQTLIMPQMSTVLLRFPALTGSRNDQLQQNLAWIFKLVPRFPGPPQHPSLPRPKEMLLTVWSTDQYHQRASYRCRISSPTQANGTSMCISVRTPGDS